MLTFYFIIKWKKDFVTNKQTVVAIVVVVVDAVNVVVGIAVFV